MAEIENYNETVLLPLLEKRVHALTSQTILLEAKAEIAEKKIVELTRELESFKNAPVPTNTPEDIQEPEYSSTN